MGVGKTTIGEILAKKLDYDFIDMDAEIAKREGATISEIFRIQGEPIFRKMESRLVEELSQNDKLVIACGGGAITNQDNADTLSKTSRMVHLTASIKEIIKRTNHDNNRPLLKVQNPYDIASELYEKRKPVYSKYAEVTIDTTGKTPEEVVEMVLEALF
jgi:shikimate kinase